MDRVLYTVVPGPVAQGRNVHKSNLTTLICSNIKMTEQKIILHPKE
jgi:hypothetical protein